MGVAYAPSGVASGDKDDNNSVYEHARAEAATQAAHLANQEKEQERRRATQAEAQAARYAAMLKALGVAVDEP